LLAFACTDPKQQTAAHRAYCPMCRLVALETAESVRGVNPPRPFAIRPPIPGHTGDNYFYPEDIFTVGINLFGDAAGLFPYIAQAMYHVGEHGVGYGRGHFNIRSIEAVHPLGNRSKILYDGSGIVALPK